MISLTRLNGDRFVLNADVIRTIEETPDTTITLTTGEHVIVRERTTEVVRLAIEYGRHLRRFMPVAEPPPAGVGR